MRKFFASFGFAIKGIRLAFKGRNFKVQFVASILVILFAFLLKISQAEFFSVLLCCALVMCLEIINSSIETLCDTLNPSRNLGIKQVKDLAAGAVLLASLFSVIIAGMIFTPKIIALFCN